VQIAYLTQFLHLQQFATSNKKKIPTPEQHRHTILGGKLYVYKRPNSSLRQTVEDTRRRRTSGIPLLCQAPDIVEAILRNAGSKSYLAGAV
jgi:hypothetical protein